MLMEHKKKKVAIIQARMGSKRLPGKVLMNIEGKPMLWHVVNRVASANLLDDVIIATSTNKKDDIISDFSQKHGFRVFRGSEDNCLGRYYEAAKRYHADIVIRITADCPLVSPEIIDKSISIFTEGRFDYVSNALSYSYPEGYTVEVFSSKVLKKTCEEAENPLDREHVTLYARNSGKFRTKNIKSEDPVDPTEYKWSVDTTDDLKFIRAVYRRLYKNGLAFSLKETMNLLNKNPEIKALNSGSVVNEGYYKSIRSLPKIKRLFVKRSAGLSGECKFEKSSGCRLLDASGNEYLDCDMESGKSMLGRSNKRIKSAVNKALKRDVSLIRAESLRTELSRLMCRIIPCAEKIEMKPENTGFLREAAEAAAAYTKKSGIAYCLQCDPCKKNEKKSKKDMEILGDTGRPVFTFRYNEIETLKKLFNKKNEKIGCVIMEPIDTIRPKADFLNKVKKLIRENSALLIFDETRTGLRISLNGAQGYFKVTPDLACFGEAMANGFPISAVMGKGRIMKLMQVACRRNDIKREVRSLTSAIETIKEVEENNVIDHVWEQGRKLRDGYNVLAKEYGLEKLTWCEGLAPMSKVIFKGRNGRHDNVLGNLFRVECAKRGVLFAGSHNPAFSHSNMDIERILRVYDTAFGIIRKKIGKDET
jgi:spore coat polysaccharide biosynthesis protein SpsF (cytidylyltransferase family)/glutamate-1-semialdehyde aminotransferase